MIIVLVLLLAQSPILEDGGIIGWMEVTMYAYTYNSVFLVCMDGWHMYHFFISYMPVLCMCISCYDHFIYACVKGEFHLKSPPKIFVITLYVLSSSKRGRLLAQRPLARSFDDNKTYIVMF